MGAQKKQIQLLENMVNVLDTYKKKYMAPFENYAGRLQKPINFELFRRSHLTDGSIQALIMFTIDYKITI